MAKQSKDERRCLITSAVFALKISVFQIAIVAFEATSSKLALLGHQIRWSCALFGCGVKLHFGSTNVGIFFKKEQDILKFTAAFALSNCIGATALKSS